MFLKWWAKFTVNRKKQSGLAFEEINPAPWAHSEAVTAMHCSFSLGFFRMDPGMAHSRGENDRK